MLFLRAGSDSEVRSSHDDVAGLVAAIETLAEEDGWPADLTFRISLVVDELAQNIVDYAYQGTAGDMDVEVTSLDETLVIKIVDEGRPFDPLTDAPDPDLTSPIEDRPIGGLGVHFAKTLMDDIEYRRESGKNRLRIVARKRPSG